MLIGLPPVGIFLIWKYKKFNKITRIILTIVFSLVTLFNIWVFSSTSDSADIVEPSTAISQKEEQTSSNNSNEKLTEIIKQAETDAQNSTDADDEKAVKYLSDNINNCFESNETMERYIYYGAFLDSKYNDNELSKIGFQAVKTTKYVYRNIETATDSVTVNNVKKLREMLDEYNNPTTSPITTENTVTKTTVTTEATIDETTTITTTELETTEEYKTTYILNTNTHKFHHSGCSQINKMNEENKDTYEGTRDEVINMGYSPCGKCNP